jgi:hypothetical protein
MGFGDRIDVFFHAFSDVYSRLDGVEDQAMAEPAKGERLPLSVRVIVALLNVVFMLPFLGAFWLSWSSGLRGEHKGDEAVRDILVAIALLALGLVFAIPLLCSLLWNILVRVNKVDGQRRQTTDQTELTT